MKTPSFHEVVCFGEILWDLLPSGPQPGGAPMNVAYQLHKLGKHPAMISRIGTDERGNELLQLLQSKGLNTDYIQRDQQIPTGIVLAEQHANGDMSYDIVSPSAWDHITADENVIALVKQATYFVFGSLSARHQTSRDTLFQLLEHAQTKVLDINLRPPHYNQPLLESLLQKADILKLNIDELELVTDWYGSYTNTKDRICFLQDRFNIPSMIITLGAKGAVLNVNGKTYTHPGYKVKVADTVGSGDSFLAAILSQTIDKAPPVEMLDFANRLAATIATHKGGMPDYEMKELQLPSPFINL